MTARRWPFPGDAPIVRARRVGLAYRAKARELEDKLAEYRELLARVNPSLVKFADNQLANEIQKMLALGPDENDVESMDRRFLDWGETWHTPIEISYAPEDEVRSKVAAQLIQVSENTIGKARIHGRLPGRWIKPVDGYPGHFLYKVADVYALSGQLRGRHWRSSDGKDKVSDNGRSDAN